MNHRSHEHHSDYHGDQPGPGRGRGRGWAGRNRGLGMGHGMGPGMGSGGRRRGRGGGPRRGDIRIALLSALADAPGHGYELIQRLDERTGGRWKPSPGSVYPTLQMLEELGHVTGADSDGKRVYTITEAGRAELAARADGEGGPTPWLDDAETSSRGTLRRSAMQLMMATKQVGMAGTDQHLAAATAIVDEARRKLYQLLAEA